MGGKRFPGFIIHKLFRIPVIRANEHGAIYFFDSIHRFSYTFVYRFHCFDGSRFHTGMTHHIRVGKINDNYIVFAGFDGIHQFIAYFISAHLRFQVIRGYVFG